MTPGLVSPDEVYLSYFEGPTILFPRIGALDNYKSKHDGPRRRRTCCPRVDAARTRFWGRSTRTGRVRPSKTCAANWGKVGRARRASNSGPQRRWHGTPFWQAKVRAFVSSELRTIRVTAKFCFASGSAILTSNAFFLRPPALVPLYPTRNASHSSLLVSRRPKGTYTYGLQMVWSESPERSL